jgi:hypothetical protein
MQLARTLGRPLGRPLGYRLHGGSLFPRYDYYIDAVNGSDSNDGMSLASAWASLNKMETLTPVPTATTRVLVKSGTYDGVGDYFEVSNNSAAGWTLDVTFEAGCVMDGTACNSSAAQNPIFGNGTASWRLNLHGSGLTIQNYDNNTGGSPNGIGWGGNCFVYGSEVVITNCVDGISNHDNGPGLMVNIVVTACSKYALAQTGTGHTDFHGCSFTGEDGASGGVAVVNADASAEFFDTKFIPVGTARNLFLSNSNLVRCQLGTETDDVIVAPVAVGTCVIRKSYVHVETQQLFGVAMYECFGRFSMRLRDSGTPDIQHCVFTGPAESQGAVLYANTGSAFAAFVFSNNILAGSFTFDSLGSRYNLLEADNELENNLLFGGVAYSGNLTGSAATIAGTVTGQDPLIGAADSYLMSDWAFGAGSPAIGAANDDGDIGFGAADVEDIVA